VRRTARGSSIVAIERYRLDRANHSRSKPTDNLRERLAVIAEIYLAILDQYIQYYRPYSIASTNSLTVLTLWTT
jgi:hypothetical protein